jgi:hypothetical protein
LIPEKAAAAEYVKRLSLLSPRKGLQRHQVAVCYGAGDVAWDRQACPLTTTFAL